MASIFGLETGSGAYPYSKELRFGSDFAHSDFVIPMARFKFYEPTGEESSSAPTIYVRMPGTFNTALINNYAEAQGIFGRPGEENSTLLNALGRLAGGGVEGLQKQVLSAVSGAAGFIGSAGLSGKAQIEFLQRRFLNNFQQLIYQGPTFRRFQLPFAMKPTSKTEAESMIDIISTFRVASSPKAISRGDDAELSATRAGAGTLESSTGGGERDENIFPRNEEGDARYQQYLAEVANQVEIEEAIVDLGNETDVLTFGYPDMCKFDIILYTPSQSEGIYPLFSSEYCMIESVAVDYGGQNKMTFFDSIGDPFYYPSEVNLTISLREAVLVTASLAGRQYTEGKVIL
jgi:hypothetical protein